jgi:hypothetical protein
MTLSRWVVVLCALSASLAWADVPPKDSIGCRDKTAGATCATDDGASGTCATATCTRNDYSQGPPPKSVPYECLKCVAGAAPAAPKKSGCAAVSDLSLAAVGAWLLRRRAAR